LQRRLMVGRASGFIAYGSLAAEYLKQLGAKPEKISIGINTVDTTFFKQETQRQRSFVKADGKKHLIFTGYLVPRKNILKLLVCIRNLSTKRNDFILDILGDGSDRPRLEKYVKDLGLQDFVSFHGFIQREDLPAYFSKGSCFLFQTGFDIWGLVLNEAMAAGLPVISSINAGATFDLVQDGITGYRVDFEEVEKVADTISQLLDNPRKAAEMGQNASGFIEEKASLKASASGFVRAILTA
jgi:glycosyltransferase involved in cell wall biosynthesis